MKITVVARNVDMHGAQEEAIKERVERAVGKYPDKSTEAAVIISMEGHFVRAEINIKGKSTFFHADELGDDIRTSLDASIKKVMTQMRRHKDKIKTRRR